MNNIESAELSSKKMVVYTQNKRYNKNLFLLLFPVFCVTTSDLLFSIFFFSFTQVIENLCYPKNPGTSGMPISFFSMVLQNSSRQIFLYWISCIPYFFFPAFCIFCLVLSAPEKHSGGSTPDSATIPHLFSVLQSYSSHFWSFAKDKSIYWAILTKCSFVIELCTIHKIPFNKIPQTILSNCKGLSYPCS